MTANSQQIRMRRKNLDELPALSIPAGYALRSYRPGDEASRCDIMEGHMGKGWTEEKFRAEVLDQPVFRPDGLHFAIQGEQLVGSACAWWMPELGATTGVLHMVAVRPDHQGRGLGKLLCLSVMHFFKQVGMQDCVLHTYTYRETAIRLYLQLGFRPELTTAEAVATWEQVHHLMPPSAD